jgi:hypothetical protein
LQKNISFCAAQELGADNLLGQLTKPFGVVINRQNIRQYIVDAGAKILGIISKDIEGKLISLSFDSASRYRRSVFSASVRYMKDSIIYDRVIGAITQTDRQFGRILSAQLIQLLTKIGKTFDDVYCTCCDNGSNMIKASELLFESQQHISLVNLFVNDGKLICFQKFR